MYQMCMPELGWYSSRGLQVLQLLHGTGWRGCENNDPVCTGLHLSCVSAVSSLLLPTTCECTCVRNSQHHQWSAHLCRQ